MKLARIVVLSVLLLSVPVAGAAPEAPATPSNGLIAYSLWEETDGDPEDFTRRLYTVDPQGGEPTLLTQGLDSEWNARWSPDGTQILFLRVVLSIDPDTGEQQVSPNHLFVAKPDGSDARQLTTGNRSAHEAEWSPDGQRIAFTRAYKPGASRRDLYVIDADGSDLLRLTDNRNWKQPKVKRNSVAVLSWSPNGRTIAFAPGYEGLRGKGVFTVRSDGSQDPKRVLSGVHVSGLDWSPIDGRLALAVMGGCARDAPLNYGGLGILNLRTGKDVRIAKSAKSVEWSPNARRLTYDQYRCGRHDEEVRVVRASGKQDHAVPTYPKGGDWYSTSPHWSPDGDLIAFQLADREDDCSRELRVGASSGGSDEVVVELECGDYIDDLDWQTIFE